jgi:hypothetical protein
VRQTLELVAFCVGGSSFKILTTMVLTDSARLSSDERRTVARRVDPATTAVMNLLGRAARGHGSNDAASRRSHLLCTVSYDALSAIASFLPVTNLLRLRATSRLLLSFTTVIALPLRVEQAFVELNEVKLAHQVACIGVSEVGCGAPRRLIAETPCAALRDRRRVAALLTRVLVQASSEEAVEALCGSAAFAVDRWLQAAMAGTSGVLVINRMCPEADVIREWWIALGRVFGPSAADGRPVLPYTGGTAAADAASMDDGMSMNANTAFSLVMAGKHDVYRGAHVPDEVARTALHESLFTPVMCGPAAERSRAGGKRGGRGGHHSAAAAATAATVSLSFVGSNTGHAGMPRTAFGSIGMQNAFKAGTSVGLDCVLQPVPLKSKSGNRSEQSTDVIASRGSTEILTLFEASDQWGAGLCHEATGAQGSGSRRPLLRHDLIRHAVVQRVDLMLPFMQRLPPNFGMFSVLRVCDLSGCWRMEAIGSYAFAWAPNLVRIVLPPQIRSIGTHFCQGAHRLDEVTGMPRTLKRGLPRHAYCDRIGDLPSLASTLPYDTQAIPAQYLSLVQTTSVVDLSWFENAQFLRKGVLMRAKCNAVLLPPRLKFIGNEVLLSAQLEVQRLDLTGFHIVEIGGRFLANSNIREVILPATLQRIGHGFLAHCTKLKLVDVTLATRLRSVGQNFTACDKLAVRRHYYQPRQVWLADARALKLVTQAGVVNPGVWMYPEFFLLCSKCGRGKEPSLYQCFCDGAAKLHSVTVNARDVL